MSEPLCQGLRVESWGRYILGLISKPRRSSVFSQRYACTHHTQAWPQKDKLTDITDILCYLPLSLSTHDGYCLLKLICRWYWRFIPKCEAECLPHTPWSLKPRSSRGCHGTVSPRSLHSHQPSQGCTSKFSLLFFSLWFTSQRRTTHCSHYQTESCPLGQALSLSSWGNWLSLGLGLSAVFPWFNLGCASVWESLEQSFFIYLFIFPLSLFVSF